MHKNLSDRKVSGNIYPNRKCNDSKYYAYRPEKDHKPGFPPYVIQNKAYQFAVWNSQQLSESGLIVKVFNL